MKPVALGIDIILLSLSSLLALQLVKFISN